MGKANEQWISGAVGMADTTFNTMLGMALEKHNDRRQLRQQGKLSEQAMGYNKQMAMFNKGLELDQWKATGPVGQMEQYKAAGLNPALMYGMGGGGGATVGGSTGSGVQAGGAPSGGGEILGAHGMGILQKGLAMANIKLMESQAKKNEVDAAKTAGADTKNTEADTANKVLDSVIKKYTGKALQDEYEIVKKNNYGKAETAYAAELEARQAIASNIYELWVEGKLKEKSVAEVEEVLLSNAKDRAQIKQIHKTMDLMEENIKGAKLDNIIKELETELQLKTGVDSKGPTWLKMIGRLIVNLTD